MSKFATLVVEDAPIYQDIYRRAVERLGGEVVVVPSYEEAVKAIKRRLFAVGVIDIRLAGADDTNEDGIKVLQYIRKIGDSTNTIVITGHGDLNIGWEASRRYGAYEAFAKKSITLTAIEGAISGAYSDFDSRYMREKVNYSAMLKDPLGPLWEWEDRARRASAPKDGMDGLYRFLDGFLRGVAPLLQHSRLHGCIVSSEKRVAAGLFWSRALGLPIFVAFGQKGGIDNIREGPGPKVLAELLPTIGEAKLGAVVKSTESYGVHGIVRALFEHEFTDFDLSKLSE